jgi:hypothetical protein
MSARAARTRRLRRERREAIARAEREWVCGGPLVEHDRPVIGGDDARHPELVAAAMRRAAERVQVEVRLLAAHFADRCLLLRAERGRMLADFLALHDELARRLGPLRPEPTHTTHPGMRPPKIPTLP